MRRFLMPPVFADPEMTRRAVVLYQIVFSEMAIVTAILLGAAFTDPNSHLWFVSVALFDILLTVVVLAICRSGRIGLASWVLIACSIALTTARAPWIGGVRSPALMLYGGFTLVAGILLGKRAGYLVGSICLALCLGMLLAGEFSLLPAQTIFYGSGTYFWLLLLNMGFVFFLMDLSNRSLQAAFRQASSELAQRRKAEQHLDIALDAGEIGIWEGDPKAQQCITVDERITRITGLARNEKGAIGFDAFREIIVSPDWTEIAAAIAALDGRRRHAKAELRIRRPDGEVRCLEITATPLKDSGPQSVRYIGTLVDVTDKKTAADEREQLVQMLQERVKELRVLYLAGQLLRDRAFEPQILDELAALLPQGWTHAENCEARITYGDHVAATPGWRETQWRQAARFETSGGAGLVEIVYLKEFPAAGDAGRGPFTVEEGLLLASIVEMLTTYIEIAQRDRRQRLLEQRLRESQKLEAMGKLAGGIAHDITNLLTGIMGYAHLLLGDLPEDSEQHHFARRINAACHRGREIVDQILTFASSGSHALASIGLVAFLKENEPLVGKMLASNTLMSMILPEEEIFVRSNSAQLVQLLINICKNAGDSYNDRPGIVEVLVRAPDTGEVARIADGALKDASRLIGVPMPSQAYGVIRIRDAGSGIAPDVLQRMFDPFFSTKGKRGTGLGLSIVQRIIDSQSGFCLIETAVGVGTTFSIYLLRAEVGMGPNPVGDPVDADGAVA